MSAIASPRFGRVRSLARALLVPTGAVALLVAPAIALDGEPSALVCGEFRAEFSRVLASGPDSLQVNNLLFEAARKGCVGALDTLLAVGASRLARDRSGNTALAIAARAGRLPFVKALLANAPPEEAAQLERANVAGSTPLIQAALGNRADVALALIAGGANVDAVNAQGETALSAAAFAGNFKLATVLLERKAKPDTVDATGKSVIVYAAARGASDIVGELLDAGVDPNARYRSDLTALMWAAGHADAASVESGLRTVKLLLAHGAKLDLVDDRGRNALMIAASLGHGAIAKALIEAGADPTLRDKAGASAAGLAASQEIKALLTAP